MKKILLVFCLLAGVTLVCNAQHRESAKIDSKGKAQELQKVLKLNQDQTTKVAEIYSGSFAQFEKIREKDKGNMDKIMLDLQPLKTQTFAKIRTVLDKGQVANYNNWLKQISDPNGGWATNQGDGSK